MKKNVINEIWSNIIDTQDPKQKYLMEVFIILFY